MYTLRVWARNSFGLLKRAEFSNTIESPPPPPHTHTDVHEPGARTGDLRLYGDRNNGWGAVEVYNIGVGWVSICPDGFDNDDALVVCKQFGYEIGTSTSYRQVYI